jgi:hypothetical protein
MQFTKLAFISLLLVVSASADYVILTVKSEADALQADIDATAGYPKSGKNVGFGKHVPAAQARTLHQYDVVKHPTLNNWSVKVDDFPAKVPVGKTPVTKLPSDWSVTNSVIHNVNGTLK